MTENAEPTEEKAAFEKQGLKVCNFCAEEIKIAAKICRYCNREQDVPDQPAKVLPNNPLPTNLVPASNIENTAPQKTDPPEAEIYKARLHWWIYFVPASLLLILSAICLVAIIFMGAAKTSILLLFIPIVGIVLAALRQHSTEYVITTRRFHKKTGILGQRTMEILLKKIETVQVEFGILGKMIDCGDVVLTGTGSARDPVAQIDDPKSFRDALASAIALEPIAKPNQVALQKEDVKAEITIAFGASIAASIAVLIFLCAYPEHPSLVDATVSALRSSADTSSSADSEPARLVMSLYKSWKGLSLEHGSMDYLSKFFDANLTQLVLADLNERKTTGASKLDFDPLYDSQYLTSSAGMKTFTKQLANNEASVEVNLEGKDRKLLYVLRKFDGEWRVSNIKGPDWDLLDILNGVQTSASSPVETVLPPAPSRMEELNSKDTINKMLEAADSNNEELILQYQSRLKAIPILPSGDTEAADRFNKLGLAALKEKSFNAAAENFASAAAADAADPKYLSNLAYAETFDGNLDSAEVHILSSIALGPTRAVAWDDLALILAKKGDQTKAVAALLLGYRMSQDKKFTYLESLEADEDPLVAAAAKHALNRLRP